MTTDAFDAGRPDGDVWPPSASVATSAEEPPPSPLPPAGTDAPGSNAIPASERLDTLRDMALQSVPEVLRDLSLAAAQTWGMNPGVVLVTLLHHLAAALGTRHRLRQEHLGFTTPFNLVLCEPASARGSWVEYLGEPWMGSVRLLLRYHQHYGAPRLREELQGLEQRAMNPMARPDMGPLADQQKDMASLAMKLKPCAIVRSTMPGHLFEAVSQSFDRCVLSVRGGLDPMQELAGAGNRQIQELCRLLEMSWQDWPR
jgi:hypothetical protein